MKQHHLRNLVPGVLAAAALALALSVGAQTTAPPGPGPAAKSPQTAPMPGHHKGTADAKHSADMKAECQAMMTKHQEMQDKLQAMDATMDKLVAEMNAAKESKATDAMEKPMVAVINELVSQRKAFRSMMMEMQPAMMRHMTHHMQMHGAKGAMDCPMMKEGGAPESKTEEKMPGM